MIKRGVSKMGTPFFKKQERKKDGEKINCILLSELRV